MGGMNTSLPKPTTMLRRAVTLHCPLCGSRKTTVRRWLGHYERCRSCGIRWHREHGFELGPIALNVVVTFFLLGISMLAAFVITAPDFPVVPLMITFVTAAIVIPLVMYPFTFMVWQAFDLFNQHPDEAELAEAAAFIAEHPVQSGRRGKSLPVT